MKECQERKAQIEEEVNALRVMVNRCETVVSSHNFKLLQGLSRIKKREGFEGFKCKSI